MSHLIGITVFTRGELAASPKLLDDLVRVINLAFTQLQDVGFVTPRFADREELLDSLGSEGLCAVARLDASIVASAGIVPWRPSTGGIVHQALKEHRPNDCSLVDRDLSYEVKAAVTANTSESRGKGLVELCIKELVSRLPLRHPREDSLLLWVQLVEDQNGAYWRRRGYEQVGPIEVKSKGSWGCTRDFNFATLVKRVRMRADDSILRLVPSSHTEIS